jgi:hypothetical protein
MGFNSLLIFMVSLRTFSLFFRIKNYRKFLDLWKDARQRLAGLKEKPWRLRRVDA